MINKSKIIKEAQKFVAKGQLDKAIAEYDKILKEAPNDANTHNTVGDLYLKRGDKDNAIESFKKAAEVFNKDGFTLKAIALYKKVLNINPDRVDIMMLMGKLNAERGLIGSANEHYLAAAAYFSRQGQKVKAIDIYKTLCDLNPDNLSLTQKLVDLYLSEGFEREGISKLIELADKKIALGELKEAREFLDKAAPKSLERFEFIRISALLELKENRLPEAIAHLENARSLDPSDARTAMLLGEAFYRSGRYEEAAGLYQDVLQKDPKNDPCRRQLMEVLIKAGDYSSAWKEYDSLIEDRLTKNELSEAEGLIREFLKHKPDDTEAKQALIRIYQKTGRESEVPAVYREVADIYFNAGETGKAANVYRQVLEIDPDNAEIKARLLEIESGPTAAKAPEPPLTEIEPARPAEVPELVLEEETPATSGIEEGMEGEFPQLDLGEETPFEGMPEAGDNMFGLPDADMGSLEDFEGLAETSETGMDVFSGEGGEPVFGDFGMPGPETGEQEVMEGHPSGFPALDKDVVFSEAEQQPVSEETAGGYPAMDEDIAFTEPPQQEVIEEHVDSFPAFDEGAGFPEMPQGVAEEAASLEEQLTEIDVYIKYGLLNKAAELIVSLENTYPADPAITKKKIELCKVHGDVDGFVQNSVELADLYTERGMFAEAGEVVKRAIVMDPGSDQLVDRLGRLSETAVQEEQAPALEPDGTALTLAPEETEAAMLPGSVHYIEDLAEADFYAQQGLIDEAREIYRRMFAADPGNEELRSRLENLQGANAARAEVEIVPQEKTPVARKVAPVQVEPAPPAPAEQHPESLEDDLDAAFREMDFNEEEETPSIASAETVAEAHEEAAVTATPAPSEEAEESEFFDLAAELQEEMAEEMVEPDMPVAEFEDKHLEEVFKEFKKGVEEQLGKEDYETHYNLGIAYKEMGMLDEAISEFTLASRDQARSLDCASMLGLCYMEKAEYDKAIALFRKGLDIKGREKEEYLGLKYDLAEAYEQAGDAASAYACLREIAEVDEGFRDVKFRLEALGKALGDAVPVAGPAVKKGPAENPAAPAKKSKVSYL